MTARHAHDSDHQRHSDRHRAPVAHRLAHLAGVRRVGDRHNRRPAPARPAHRARHEAVEAAGITSTSLVPLAAGLWSALALLPALGGGDSDDPLAVAAVGGGRSFTFGSRLAASVTDAGPGLFVPSLAIVGAAAGGWPGWLAGLALAWNGVAVGQLSGASSAILMRRVGPTWALLMIAALVMGVAATVVSSGVGPGRWWSAAVDSPIYLVPILLTGALALWGAWRLNRPNDRALNTPRHPPASPTVRGTNDRHGRRDRPLGGRQQHRDHRRTGPPARSAQDPTPRPPSPSS